MNENENIGTLLDGLDDEDMARVERLINKLASSKHQDKKSEQKPVKKRKKSPEPLDESHSESRMRGGRAGRRKKTGDEPSRRKNKGKAARRESILIGEERENKFLTTTDSVITRTLSKNTDKKIDKLLAGDSIPSERRKEPNLIEVECAGDCGYIYEVSPDLVFQDSQKGPVYFCNECSTSRRH